MLLQAVGVREFCVSERSECCGSERRRKGGGSERVVIDREGVRVGCGCRRVMGEW